MKLEVLVVNAALQQLHRETVPLRDGAKVAVAHARIIARMQKRYPEWFRIHVKECNPK
jgi:hypothetical protein